MKKVITLLLAAGLVIGAASAANAVDIKAKGLWHNAMSFADRNFEKHNGSDKMQNATRIRTQIDVIASESLKGVVYFEIGPQNWGKGADGASLGTDGKVVKVRYNYVDWVIPQTDAKVRMGLQNFSLPGFALPNVILGGGGVGCETAQFLIEHGVTDVRVMDSKRVGNKMGMLRTMFLDIEYPGDTIKKSRNSKVTNIGDHEITYAFTNKAKKTVEKTRHFDSLVIATGMHSRPTQELTDACSELGIPCDVIGSAKKADMGIEATADAYAAAMKV